MSRTRSAALLLVAALAAAAGLGCESPDDTASTPAQAKAGNGTQDCNTAADCDDGNPCTADSCNGAHKCVNHQVSNGTSCDDGNPCTTIDTCQNGTCIRANAPNGTACNDGNACSHSDTCQNGACVGSGWVVCAASDQCHVAGTCDPSSGACSNPAKADGTACNDGNACTQTDTCQSGVCTGANPVVCAALDQCHVAGTCDPMNGVCSNPNAGDGTSCSDGNACTQTDTCQSGSCVGANPVVCAALDQCHVAGTCDPSNGVCSNPNADDGTSCNDGNACTQTDTCQSGSCVGANPVVCLALDQCHVAGVCNSSTGVCSNPDAPNGTSCNDGNACTQTDTCQAGTCVGANPVVCVASDQCHVVGVCDTATGTCSTPTKADGAGCNDGNACTQTDTCQAGACVGANPVGCKASDQCHVAGTCDPANGQCSNPAVADGTGCNDGNACTQADTCQSGACVGADPVVCAASDACHDVGTCDTTTGQCDNPVKADGASCEDGNPCTLNDTCQGGACTAGAPRDCFDGDPCTVDGCDTTTGECVFDPMVCGNAGVNNCSGVCVSGCTVICSAPALGCSHGYWKTHLDSWVGLSPNDCISTVFDVPSCFQAPAGDTLLEAPQYHGGSGAIGAARILLRQAVAARLNETNPTIGQSPPWSNQDCVSEVNDALSTADRQKMLDMAASLAAENSPDEGGCPLN